MAFFRGARVGVNHESVATVAKLYLAEAVRCSAIIDKNVVRLDVCRSVRSGIWFRLDGLHNTSVDITTAM